MNPLPASVDLCCASLLQRQISMENCRLKPGSQQQDLTCGACHRIYRSKPALARHVCKHEQPAMFTCSDCGKTFPTRTRLNIHNRVHSGERPFKCLYCPVYFASTFQQKLHHRRHTGEKPYICSSCKKSFSSSSGLKQHVRTHTNESPFSCSHCSRSFKQMEKLKQHERIHTGVRPYMCDRCPSTFRVKNSLVRHLRLHSGEMVQCKLCPKVFGELYALKKHHRRQHDKFELTSSVNTSVSEDMAVSRDTDFSLAKHIKNSPEILKKNRLNNEEQQVQGSCLQKIRHVSNLQLNKVVAERLHLAVGHGDMSTVVDEYGWHRIPLSAASGLFNRNVELPASELLSRNMELPGSELLSRNMELPASELLSRNMELPASELLSRNMELPGSELLSRNMEPHNENMKKVTAVLNTEEQHDDLPLHQNKGNSLEAEKTFVQKQCFISTGNSRLIPPPTSEAAADIYEQKTITVNKADQQGEQAPKTGSSREISRPSTIEYFPSLDQSLRIDNGDSSQFLMSPSPEFTSDCCVRSPACVPRDGQFLQQCHFTNCADCGVIFPRFYSRPCHQNLQQTKTGKQQTLNPGSFYQSQSWDQQGGLHHHHKATLHRHSDDGDLPTHSSTRQWCSSLSTPQGAPTECPSTHQRCNSLSTPQGAPTECPSNSWPSHQFRSLEATTFGENPHHIQHLLHGSYQPKSLHLTQLQTSGLTQLQTSSDLPQLQTSPGLSQLQTSSGLTQLQTSSDLPQLQTSSDLPQLQTSGLTQLQTSSSGLTQLQTSSGLTQLQTSSGLTHLQTSSGLTQLQTSSGLTHLQTSSGLTQLQSSGLTQLQTSGLTQLPASGPTRLPQSSFTVNLSSSGLCDHKSMSPHAGPSALTFTQPALEETHQPQTRLQQSVQSHEQTPQQQDCVESNQPCIYQLESVKSNEPCMSQFKSVKLNESLKSDCHLSHEHCSVRSNHPLLCDLEMMPSNQQLLQQHSYFLPNQHQPAESTELEPLLCKICLPVGSATVADISTCRAFTLSNTVPRGNSVGTCSPPKPSVFHHKPLCAPGSPGVASPGKLWKTCHFRQRQHSNFHHNDLTPSTSEDVRNVPTMSILSGQGDTSIRGPHQLVSVVTAITDNLDLPDTATDTSIIHNENSRNVFTSCELVQPSTSGSGNISLMAHLPALEHMMPSDAQHTGAAVLSIQECSNTHAVCSHTKEVSSNVQENYSHTKEVSSNVQENCSYAIKVCSNSQTFSSDVKKHCSDTLKICSNTQEVSSNVHEYCSDIQIDCSETHQRELVVQQTKHCSLVSHKSTTKSANLRTSNRSTTRSWYVRTNNRPTTNYANLRTSNRSTTNSGNFGTNNRSATKSRNLRASNDIHVELRKLPGRLAVNNMSQRGDYVWKARNISDNVSSCGGKRGKVRSRVSENRTGPGVRSKSVNRADVRYKSVSCAYVRSKSVNHAGVRSKSVNRAGVTSKSVNRAGLRSPCCAAAACRKQRSQDGSSYLCPETCSSRPASPAHRDVCSLTLQEQLPQTRTAGISHSGDSERTESAEKDAMCFVVLKPKLSKAMRRSKRSTSVSERTETSKCLDKFGESVGDSCQPLPEVSASVAASSEASAEKACQSGQIQEHCQACSDKSDHLQCATNDNQSSQGQKHKMNRHGVKHECSTCSKQFPSRYRLQRHVKTHVTRKPHPCHLCAQVFPTEKYLDNHLRRHDKQPAIFSCQNCGKIFGRKYQLKIHMRTHSGEKPYKCPQCSHHFATSFQVQLHERVHSDVQAYQCQHCGQRFRSNANLTLHVRRHTNDRPYLCATCGAAFYEASKLTAHIRVHTGVHPFMCDQCPKTFKVQHLLVRHSRWHTGQTFHCEHCNKQFDERWILRAHVARRHSGK